MTEHLTISSEPPEHSGMNFSLLRQEGIKHIERLAGKLWTDYNTHDPGITILEQLCYAITDLSYRLDFEMKDLLAPFPGENRKQFFTAREILTVNPLTINDYRKLLIDIDGVKNAWLEPIKNSQPPIYYDSILHALTFQASENTQQVNLNGLYRVMIEKEENVSDKAGLIEKVKSKLNQHRNLCEDFATVEILPIEEISVKAEIEIEESFDVNELMAKIYFGLDNFISPHLQFFTLKELLDKGKNTEVIFDGFPLEHGFIDDEQLDSFIKKDELHTSDLIRIILDIPGIKNVRSRSISISSSKSSESEEWALALDSNQTPQLKDIGSLINNITFYKKQISCNLNLDKAQSYLESLQQENTKSPSTTQTKDIPIPMGQYRELSDYESIQKDFPATYGIGELGLPASSSHQRKAQAKQLQAYLMFFDQLLANYFAQLDHAKDLLSWQSKKKTTYFSKNLSKFPGADEILKLDNNSAEDKWNDIDKIRKNRFLDYLMAQYCEKFTDHSLLLYDLISNKKGVSQFWKLAFLRRAESLGLSLVLVILLQKGDAPSTLAFLRWAESFGFENLGFESLESSLVWVMLLQKGDAPNKKPSEEELTHINNKVAFLENYPQISAGRGKAFNYTDSSQVWDTDNISGLKQRICSLLGIPYNQQTLALSNQSDEIEGFHIVEHILLRPRSSNNSKSNSNFLAFGHQISEFQKRTDSNTIVTCVSKQHGLSNNDQIRIFDTRNYKGTYSVTDVQQNTFDINIETGFVESEEGQWVQVDLPLDPYSFQISFVFPNWLPRFENDNFKQLIYNIISAEIPAHITPYFHWLDKTKMKSFETHYQYWLNTIVKKDATSENIKSTRNNLIKDLKIGNVEIIPFKGIGYMTIGKDFVVS